MLENLASDAVAALVRAFPQVRAKVTLVDGDRITIGAGSDRGVYHGMIVRFGSPLTDPLTGEVLQDGSDVAVAWGRVGQVNPESAICTLEGWIGDARNEAQEHEPLTAGMLALSW